MSEERPKLVEPCVDLKEAFLEMASEFAAEGHQGYKKLVQEARTDFAAFVSRRYDQSRGIGLPKGWVPHNVYWLVAGSRLLGTSNFRHVLNEHLEHEAGHIGYGIRPSERRKGYGTLILRLTLDRARAKGLRRVIVTCDTDNAASARVIEKNGGLLEDYRIGRKTGKQKSRYWIDFVGRKEVDRLE